MPRRYSSFDDAWRDFVSDDDYLESFFVAHSGPVETWWVVPPPEVERAALRLQSELEGCDFLLLLPHDWLHVTVPRPVTGAELRYARVNCFPDAVVVEVDGLPRERTFLPHMTLALVTRPVHPQELRERLLPLRDVVLGEQRVAETLRVSLELTPELEGYRVLDRA